MIGTGSLRRRAQLLHFRRDLVMKDIRGNVNTRLRKLREGQYDALLLAEAGLQRLGFDREIAEAVPLAIVLPAAGQGALGSKPAPKTTTPGKSSPPWTIPPRTPRCGRSGPCWPPSKEAASPRSPRSGASTATG